MVEHPNNLYTRKGDSGITELAGHKNVQKESLRIQAIGDVDELNCQLGIIRMHCTDGQMKSFLGELQELLFEMETELSQPGTCRLAQAHTARAEQFIDRLNDVLPPLKAKVLPGGSRDAAHCYLARAVCRRAERDLFRLARTEHVNSASLHFLNRLSDLLFVVARTMNHRSETAEIPWAASARRQPS